MANYRITCCSTVDLSAEHLQARQVSYLPFHYYLDDVSHSDDLFTSMSAEEFYSALKNGAEPKTAQVNTDEYIEYFTKILEEGEDILHIALSSGLSGSYNSARVAKDILTEKYPDRKIYVVDSLAASSGFGLLIDGVADKRDEGLSIDELYAWVEENKKKLHHWFFSTDLTFFVKGGRLSRVAGWFGTVLKICPLLNVSHDGKLTPRFKVRGKEKVKAEIVARMHEYALDGDQYSGKCFISHADCYEDAKAVADAVEATFPKLSGKVVINNIGPTIGCHTGPGTVALFFWGAERHD